jgi:hypothetical protein
MGIVTTRGIDIDGIMVDALDEPNGDQATYYWTQVKAAIGSNAIVALVRNSTDVYRDAIVGALNTSSGALVLPATLDEPPAVNTASDIDSGTWALEIRNASNSAVAIEVPLGPTGTPDSFAMTTDLDGTKLVKFAGAVLTPPALLDVGQTSSYASIAERAISMMSGYNEDELEGITNSSNPPAWSVTTATAISRGWATHASVVGGANPVYANLAEWARNWIANTNPEHVNSIWDDLLIWMVLFDGRASGGHEATNAAVEMSRYEKWVRNRFTKAWSRIQLLAMGSGEYGSKPYIIGISQSMDWRDGPTTGSRILRVPHKSSLTNRVLHPYGSKVNIANFAEIDCIAVGLRAKLVKWNPADVDDLADANVLMHIGADWYPRNSQAQALPSMALTRAMQVTTTDQWFVNACLSTARKDYINADGTVISATEYRNNPPPFGS